MSSNTKSMLISHAGHTPQRVIFSLVSEYIEDSLDRTGGACLVRVGRLARLLLQRHRELLQEAGVTNITVVCRYVDTAIQILGGELWEQGAAREGRCTAISRNVYAIRQTI